MYQKFYNEPARKLIMKLNYFTEDTKEIDKSLHIIGGILELSKITGGDQILFAARTDLSARQLLSFGLS